MILLGRTENWFKTVVDRANEEIADREALEASNGEAREQAAFEEDVEKSARRVVECSQRANDALQASVEALHSAENYFAKPSYSPFWESLENSLQSLNEHRLRVEAVEQAVHAYRGMLDSPRAVKVAGLELPESAIPNDEAASEVANRVTQLFHAAQQKFEFASIYEQRRTTAAVIQGFQSLGDAVGRLGGVVRDSYERLQASMESLPSQMAESISDAPMVPLQTSYSFGGQMQEINQNLERIRQAI